MSNHEDCNGRLREIHARLDLAIDHLLHAFQRARELKVTPPDAAIKALDLAEDVNKLIGELNMTPDQATVVSYCVEQIEEVAKSIITMFVCFFYRSITSWRLAA